LLLSAPEGEGHRSIGHVSSNIGHPQGSLGAVENLPDPMNSDMDMPL